MTGTYGLWLVPDRQSDEYEKFQNIINTYSERHDDAPKFEPHVTITGGLETTEDIAREKTEEIANNTDPVDLQFKGPHCSTTRFQCVFILVEPSETLLNINQDTIGKFNKNPYMYVPHLSIIYSDIGVKERRNAIDSLQNTDLPNSATADTIQLLESSGNVDDWDMIEDYEL